jgi:hypothetical protein
LGTVKVFCKGEFNVLCNGSHSVVCVYFVRIDWVEGAIVCFDLLSAQLLELAIPLSNAYGLVLLTLFMSYGLVDIPKGLWFNSSPAKKLRHIENDMPLLKESCVDAEAELYAVAGVFVVLRSFLPPHLKRLSLAIRYVKNWIVY